MKNKIVLKRHNFYKKVFSFVCKLYIKPKVKYIYDKFKIKDDNYIIVSNHVTTLDPIYLSLSFNKNIYFVATDEIKNKKLAHKFLNHTFRPILKKKGIVDINCTKEILKTIKEGGSVGIFIEGNRTLSGSLSYINKSIIKLIKKTKKDIICYNIIGGYGADPRWGLEYRKGTIEGRIRKIIKYDEYKLFDDDTLYEMIKENLTIYEFTEDKVYKSDKLAEKAERALYICPICNSINTLQSNGNIIKCTKCNLEVEYAENMSLSSNCKDFTFKNINTWYNYQLDKIKAQDNLIVNYQDEVLCVNSVNQTKTKIFDECILIMTNEYITFKTKEKEKNISLDDILSISLLFKTKLSINTKDGEYRIDGNTIFNGVKYIHAFYQIKKNKGENTDDFYGI